MREPFSGNLIIIILARKELQQALYPEQTWSLPWSLWQKNTILNPITAWLVAAENENQGVGADGGMLFSHLEILIKKKSKIRLMASGNIQV